MMKIMQVLTDYSVGDAGMWLLNYLGMYDREAYEMVLLLPTGSSLIKYAESLEVRVIETDAITDSFSYRKLQELKEIFLEENPDVIHTHAGVMAAIAAYWCKIPVIHTRHISKAPMGFFKRFFSGICNRMLYKRMIATSEKVMEQLMHEGVPQKRIRLVYNGIYPMRQYAIAERSVLREMHNISEKSVVIGIATPLEEGKNHAMFLEAAQFIATACPETLFMIMGDGSLREELEQLAEPLGERVLFTGYMNDMTEALNMVDILAVSSEQEGLSIPLIEAMSVSVPAVVTNAGGNAELIEQGKSGVVVGCGDIMTFAMALIRLVQHAELRENMGAYAKKTIDRRFMAETMTEQTEAVYQEFYIEEPEVEPEELPEAVYFEDEEEEPKAMEESPEAIYFEEEEPEIKEETEEAEEEEEDSEES